MTALRHAEPVSVVEYLADEETSEVRHEYLGGAVHAMAGASVRHNMIAINFVAAFHRQLAGRPCVPFGSDMKVRVQLRDHVRFYYPDAMIACHPAPPDQQFHDQPTVIVEVLSDSTRRVDLEEKREAYCMIPTLQVLVFCENDTPEALVFRRNSEGRFERETHHGLDAEIPLPEAGVTIHLADAFERVELGA